MTEPYSDKNDLKGQMDFLNNFLPLYGIASLCDIETEVSSKELTKFDEMTVFIPEIKKLFKTSVMNLSRSRYKITSTNAVPILKHLCVQANIPYEITKYASHYTFSLAPQNAILTRLRKHNNNPQVVKKNPKSKPYEYFESLPHVDMETISIVSGEKQACMEAGGELLKDTIQFMDVSSSSHAFIKLAETRRPAVRFVGLYFAKVKVWYENRGQKFIAIRFTNIVDVYRSIKSVKLYDKNGKCIHNGNKVNVGQFVFGVKDIHKNITDLNIPAWCMGFHDLSMVVPYTGEDPVFYKIEVNCATLDSKHRKIMCKNWGPIELYTEPAANTAMFEFIGDVKVRCMDYWVVPHYGTVLRNIRSDTNICINFNNLHAVSKDNMFIPLPVFTQVTFSRKKEKKDKIWEAIVEYDDIEDKEFTLDGHRWVEKCGLMLKLDTKCDKCKEDCSDFCDNSCGTIMCEKCSTEYYHDGFGNKISGHFEGCGDDSSTD